METKHKEDSLERHFEQFEGRFDSHLEVYRENGKELAGVKVEMKNISQAVRDLKKSNEKSFDKLSSVDVSFDKRIRFAENKIWYIIGIGVATTVIFGLIGFSWKIDIKETIENTTQTAVIDYINGHDFELLNN